MATALFAQFTEWVKNGDLAQCIEAAENGSNAADLEADSDDLISLLVSSESVEDGEHFNLLISKFCERGGAKVNLLSLLGGFNSRSKPARVRSLFVPIASTLERIAEEKRSKMICFALSKTLSYLSHLSESLPMMPRVEGKERIILDAEPNQGELLDYVENLATGLLAPLSKYQDTKIILANTITHVFNYAFVPVNLHPEGNFRPRSLDLAEKCLDTLVDLNANPVALLKESVEEPDEFGTGEEEEDEDDDEKLIKSPSREGVAAMFYAVYGESICPDLMPSIYDPLFIWLESMEATVSFLEHNNCAFLHKGLLLSNGLLARINKNSIGYDVIDSHLFVAFLQALINAVTFSDLAEFRQLGFKIVSGIHARLQFEAETKFFSVVMESKCHSGLKGWVITRLKDLALGVAVSDDNARKESFFGPRFRALCLRTFKLERGPETDLLEVSDEVMASLNFLWCLKIRDVAGVAEILDELRPTYVCQLEKGLEMSRVHYKMQLDEASKMKEEDAGCSVIVSGQKLPKMRKEETKSVVNAALNTLDLLECTLTKLKSAV
jgi:hypothetical protein